MTLRLAHCQAPLDPKVKERCCEIHLPLHSLWTPYLMCLNSVTCAALRNHSNTSVQPLPPFISQQCQLNRKVHRALFVGCSTSQQQASVSQGRICTDNCTCCYTETEVADQTFCLTQSQYTDTRPTSPSADPILPGAWQGSHWSANF